MCHTWLSLIQDTLPLHEAPWQYNEHSSQDPLQSLLAWVIVMDCAELMSGVHPYCICRVKSLMHKIQQNFLQTLSPPPQKISLKMQASHWSRLITWPEHWPLIGPQASNCSCCLSDIFPFSELGANVNVINCSEMPGRDCLIKTQLDRVLSEEVYYEALPDC